MAEEILITVHVLHRKDEGAKSAATLLICNIVAVGNAWYLNCPHGWLQNMVNTVTVRRVA